MENVIAGFFAADIILFCLWVGAFLYGLRKVTTDDKTDVVMIALVMFFMVAFLVSGVTAVVGVVYLLMHFL